MNNPHGSLEDKIPAIDQEISNNNNHKHYSLLPPPYLGMLRTLKNHKFPVLHFKTNCFRDSFIVSHCQ